MTPAGGSGGPSRWRAPVVLACCLVVVVALLAGADRVGTSAVSALTSRFVPADGAQWFSARTTEKSARTASTTISTESALISGSAIVGALDGSLATNLIGASNIDADYIGHGRFWRTIDTPVAPAGDQATRVYRLGDDITLVAESTALGGFSYKPHLVELPAGAAPGRTWSSHGTVGVTAVGYAAAFAAAVPRDPAASDCLEVNGTITYAISGRPSDRTVARTWCPGRGITAASDSWLGTTLTTRPVDPPTRSRPVPAPAQPAWTPPSWTHHSLAVTSVDPYFGPGDLGGSAAPVPPALTRAGTLLRATVAGNDILAIAAQGGPDQWRTRWRAHPGGSVLTVTAVDDQTVATTSDRTVVGYDAAGVRRWSLRTGEIVSAPPVAAAADELALVTRAGEVIVLDPVTGVERWRRTPGRDVGTAPAVVAGLVVLVDRSGQVSALGLDDGRTRWTAEVDNPVAVTVAAGQVLVVSETGVDAYEPGSGRTRWHADLFGNARSVADFGGWAVVTTSERVVALDRSGHIAWRRPGIVATANDGSFLVLFGRERAEVVDRAAITVTDFPVRDQAVGEARNYLVAAQGVYQVGSGWSFEGWLS